MTGFADRRIVVLAGGPSAERDISLASGWAVVRTLRIGGHHVVWCDPAETELTAFAWEPRDVAFIALHGTFGEDGEVQRILDRLGIPYTGSDAETSALAFSKSASKERFRQCGVPTPAAAVIHESDDARHIERLARGLGYPLVVKPDRQGSSLGVTVVPSPNELPAALALCFHYGPHGLLESFVEGTEWTVGLLDGTPLPPLRVETPRGFYDYEAKYRDEATRYHFDSDLPAGVLRHVTRTAQDAAGSLGTTGPVRVDLRLDRHLEPWVLEVNTVPGLTDHSLLPKAAAHIGLSFGDLCERALTSALATPTAARRVA
jgi:D-alanine-D-alanine ligase